ncbi:GIY-YIG nuclease family protein [Planktothrix sp. FACHB-1355]|uniref:GIY-YIG nuclease family protein n=1 Tax=Aerosakkonema funiforme FACHB-1375 TaxID=2949571 RepID=A0A926VBI5_9CYAN|nr:MULTISPECIES: GIY-YIG nuclease family protein [Oscillatoriales]MBD2180303.1 GIY-YIG nuclease family protein [Aerosakkonema funiforme FACHB-1375]MBD3557398.1 GIY-YIG nuclease family protein [Planktothrix sp. FACHB-1355]
MNVNFHLNSWYTSIVIANSSGLYCDHLAVCLLLELLGNVTQHKDPYHPIFSSITALADALKAPIDEVKHSLELLHKLGLIQIDYCHEPELFLAGIICIKLNQRRISELSKTNATNNRNGYIYIVRSGSSNLYKIGRTTNFQKRLKTLQTSCATQLTVVKTFFSLDAVSLEKAAHCKFAHFRQKGEWFELNSEQLTQLLSWLEHCQ